MVVIDTKVMDAHETAPFVCDLLFKRASSVGDKRTRRLDKEHVVAYLRNFGAGRLSSSSVEVERALFSCGNSMFLDLSPAGSDVGEEGGIESETGEDDRGAMLER